MSHHALGWVKGVANERKYVPGTLHSLIGPWLIRTDSNPDLRRFIEVSPPAHGHRLVVTSC